MSGLVPSPEAGQGTGSSSAGMDKGGKARLAASIRSFGSRAGTTPQTAPACQRRTVPQTAQCGSPRGTET